MHINVELRDLERSIRNFVIEGSFLQVVYSLLGVTIISAYLATAGASPMVISILVSIPFFTTAAQIISAKFVEKKNRKRIAIFASLVSKMALLALTLNAFIDGMYEILIFAIFYFIFNVCEDVYTVTSNSWARDLIPAGKRGEVLSKRSAYGRILAIPALFIQIFVFERLQREGFPLLFLTATVFGIIAILFLRNVENVKCNRISEPRITEPLRNPSFLILVLIAVLLFFSQSSARTFFAVYLLTLGYPLYTILFLAFVAHISSIYALRFSGSFSDRFGNKPLFSLSCISFIISAVIFAISSRESLQILIFAYILYGFYISAPTIAIANAVADLTYKKHSAPYYAIINWISDISSALGSIFAGFLLDSLYSHGDFAFRFLFLISAAISVLPIIATSLYDEFSPPQIFTIFKAPRLVIEDILSVLKVSIRKKTL
jgi:MFS family permease